MIAVTSLLTILLIATLFFTLSKYKRQMLLVELSNQQQKELQVLRAMIQGEEKERGRIAKDLHDGIAGMLAAAKIYLGSIPGAEDLIKLDGYQKGIQLLNEATVEIRKISHNLVPEVLLQNGLDEAISRYCNTINNGKTLQIQYDSWGEIKRFPENFELAVYRIVQELLRNAIKFSRATHAIVQLTQQDNLLSISIEDNGVVFLDDGYTDNMELPSLKDRIQAMNGNLEVHSSDQNGVNAYLEFEVANLEKEFGVVYE